MRTVAWVLVVAVSVVGCRSAKEDTGTQLSRPGADRRDQSPISTNAVVLLRLDRRGESSPTVIVSSGDDGTGARDQPLRRSNSCMNETSSSIPCSGNAL